MEHERIAKPVMDIARPPRPDHPRSPATTVMSRPVSEPVTPSAPTGTPVPEQKSAAQVTSVAPITGSVAPAQAAPVLQPATTHVQVPAESDSEPESDAEQFMTPLSEPQPASQLKPQPPKPPANPVRHAGAPVTPPKYDDDDSDARTSSSQVQAKPKPEPATPAPVTQPKAAHHSPMGAIMITVLIMVALSALTILVYLNT